MGKGGFIAPVRHASAVESRSLEAVLNSPLKPPLGFANMNKKI